jgi:succinate dehydrogenase / fumarate reductase iron-sulfur subunit
MSFLEMLDVLNEQLNAKGEEPVAFDSDCREGICGMCGLMINGRRTAPRSPRPASCTCAPSRTATTITIEPWRADAFPVIKDLVVDRSAFDRIIQAGGFISVNTGAAPEANALPGAEAKADRAFEAARVHRLRRLRRRLPERLGDALHGRQGHPPRRAAAGPARAWARVVNMVAQHDHEGFGGCTNIGECSAACPKGIPQDVISQLNKDLRTSTRNRRGSTGSRNG